MSQKNSDRDDLPLPDDHALRVDIRAPGALSGQSRPLDSGSAAHAELEQIADQVHYLGVAPDPFEETPVAREEALRPLGLRSHAFGLVRLPSNFRALSGQEKIDFLLELPDPEATVQALSCEEFAFLVKDIGGGDAATLMVLASPRQLQATVDLDGWRDDRFDPESLAGWLGICELAGPDTVDRFVTSQHDGVWSVFLARSLTVFENMEEAEVHADPDAELFSSPGGDFILTADRDDPLLPAVRATLDSLYRCSVSRGRRLLRAVRWELPAQIEDDLHEDRNSRIADHGFLPRAEARAFYVWVDADAEKAEMLAPVLDNDAPRPAEPHPFLPEAATPHTELASVGFEAGTLLGRALLSCPTAAQERLQAALVRLAYRAQAARASGLVETDELERWSRHAFTTCDTGLDWLSEGRVELAALLLQTWPLSRIFGVGHALAVRLHHRARSVRRLMGGSEGLELLEPHDAALLEGLLRPLPELCTLRDLPEADGFAEPSSEEPRTTSRPFESLEELQEARARLVAIGATARLLSGLAEGTLVQARARLGASMPLYLQAELRLTSMLGTAIAWTVLEGAARLAPLTETQARAFLSKAMQPGERGRQISPALRQALLRALLSTPDLADDEIEALEGLLDRTLDRLQSELGGLDPRAPFDPRFAGASLILASD